MGLSIVINTKNAEASIEETLASISFADEIIIMDMESSDRTVQIAENYGAKIFHHEDVGFVEPARNAAIAQASQPWILILDADETVSRALATHIKQVVEGSNTSYQNIDCFRIPRKNIIFGDWVQSAGWWPDYVVRLFKRNTVLWSEAIHGEPMISGIVSDFPPHADYAIEHNNYQSVMQFVDRLNRYTTIQANQHKARSLPATPIDVLTEELFRRLFAWDGIKGGSRSVLLSILQSMSEVVTHAKILESRKFANSIQESDVIRSLIVLKKTTAYWVADWHISHTSGIEKLYWQIRRKFAV